MTRPELLCPAMPDKQCIYNKCPAFRTKKPSLWRCEICGEVHPTGSTCSSKDHRRQPVYIKDFYYCKEYDFEWESEDIV